MSSCDVDLQIAALTLENSSTQSIAVVRCCFLIELVLSTPCGTCVMKVIPRCETSRRFQSFRVYRFRFGQVCCLMKGTFIFRFLIGITAMNSLPDCTEGSLYVTKVARYRGCTVPWLTVPCFTVSWLSRTMIVRYHDCIVHWLCGTMVVRYPSCAAPWLSGAMDVQCRSVSLATRASVLNSGQFEFAFAKYVETSHRDLSMLYLRLTLISKETSFQILVQPLRKPYDWHLRVMAYNSLCFDEKTSNYRRAQFQYCSKDWQRRF